LDSGCDVEAYSQWDAEMPGHVKLAGSRWDTASFSMLTIKARSIEENLESSSSIR
jgi:hypothetical protein